MVASIASPMVTRTLTAVDPRTAIRGHVRQLHILYVSLIHMILFRQRRPKKKKWREGWRSEIEDNPLKRLTSRKEKDLHFVPSGLDFVPPAWICAPLGFCSDRLGFRSAWFWKPFLAAGRAGGILRSARKWPAQPFEKLNFGRNEL